MVKYILSIFKMFFEDYLKIYYSITVTTFMASEECRFFLVMKQTI